MNDLRPRFPGLDGALAAAVAIGLTELAAGLSSAVPSALASVGSFVVDASPGVLKDVAISVFGTADKGALAIGTVILSLIAGLIIGRVAVTRPMVAWAGFGVFAVLGIAAQVSQPDADAVLVVIGTGLAALAGVGSLFGLYRLDSAAQSADPRDSVARDNARRRFLGAAAGAGVGAAAAMAFGRSAIIRRSEEVRAAIGLPPVSNPVADPGPENDFDLPRLTDIVQGEPEFYRIDTALIVPIVDAERWTLRVHGMVENELELTLDDVMAMEQHERYVTLSCVSNEVGDDLVGNAKWQGIRLTELLEAARPIDGADQIVGRSVDGWTAGFPTEAVFDGRDPLLAIGMNGEPLPRKHGYPARLVVPGLYGYVSATKWVSEIELTTWDGFNGYWVPRGWAKRGPIKTQSRIDRPFRGEPQEAGSVVAAGVAWAPTRGIVRVEVQVDEEPWRDAELSVPLSDDAWVQWRADLDLTEGRRRIRVRATDGTGETQPSTPTPPRPDGATGWHTIEVDVV